MSKGEEGLGASQRAVLSWLRDQEETGWLQGNVGDGWTAQEVGDALYNEHSMCARRSVEYPPSRRKEWAARVLRGLVKRGLVEKGRATRPATFKAV